MRQEQGEGEDALEGGALSDLGALEEVDVVHEAGEADQGKVEPLDEGRRRDVARVLGREGASALWSGTSPGREKERERAMDARRGPCRGGRAGCAR